ncbi:uncharacterized protein LOC105213083 [Zeugodacus cucurbitae]|uniref:uncharacterized protein LOC105213083 n=1 Tax=Zeugodacus cucurbitae TaxID=28588 RepID=UPI0023D957A9|nr:uncharacterized protein LOC105213083 [Zeugodacus cucurbitae]
MTMPHQLWLVYLSLVGVLGNYLSDFVTLRRQSNWSTAEFPATSNRKMLSSEAKQRSRFTDVAEHYQLRFKPLRQMPRLLWKKLPQVTTSMKPNATDGENVEMTSVKASNAKFLNNPFSYNHVQQERPYATSTVKPPIRPVPAPIASSSAISLATEQTAQASDALNTIMRPPQIGVTRPQLLFHGAPFKLNLLQQQRPIKKTKSKGFLSLFEVIKFENTKCSVAMEEIDIRVRALEGVCYHEFECKSLGGVPTEPCAEGVGVCCVFLNGCGDTTKQSVVYFESPNFPNPVHEMLICVLIINLRDNVQQLRLDFIMFEINRPTDGDCVEDQFIVSGQNINFVVPILCGINTGQHIYVDVANSFERKMYLSFITKMTNGDRAFNIKIMQLESDLAPEGCLQFYTENEGEVKSFNYDADGAFVNKAGATYFNNLNYVICLQRSKDMCSVSYNTQLNGGEQLDFQITNKDEDEVDLVPDGQAGAGIFNCPDDYIAINQVRLCGERFNDGTVSDDFTQNAPVKDVAAGPIILPVRSDVEYVGRGFHLIYKQELCI